MLLYFFCWRRKRQTMATATAAVEAAGSGGPISNYIVFNTEGESIFMS